MRYSLSIVIIMLLSIVSGHAQDVLSGHVVDAESGVDIHGAIVSGRSESGGMVRYVVSDGMGRFTLALSGVSYVDVSLLGYRKETLKSVSPGFITVKMMTEAVELAKSVVSAGLVEVLGDTIRYEASAMLKKSDRVLGDLLERLPGIEVSESGRIRYGGRGINRLYIDGRNVLDRDYDVATRNLDVNSVKSVSIYENHQPIKALRGSVKSRSAAIDIELKEEARNRPILNMEASAGFDKDSTYIPYDLKASMFSLSGASSHVYELGSNTTGHLSQRPSKDSYGSEMDVEDRLSVNQVLPDVVSEYSSLIDRSYTLFNHSYGARTNDRFSIGEDVSIGTRFAYSRDDFSNMSEHRTSYSSPDLTLHEIRRGMSDSDSFTGGLNMESNKNSGYVRDDLEILYDRRNSQSSISGSRSLDEDYGNDVLELNNTVNLTMKRKNGGAVTGHLYTQYNSDRGRYHSFMGEDLSQTYRRNLLWTRVVFRSVSRKKRDLSFSVTPSATLFYGNFESLASGRLPAVSGHASDDSFSLLNLNPELAIGLIYQKPHFETLLTGRARLRAFRFMGNGIGKTDDAKVIFTPMLVSLTEYKRSKWTLSNNIVFENGVVPGDMYSGALFVTGYNTCRIGIDVPVSLPTMNMRNSFDYRDPINGFYFNIDLNVGTGRMLSESRDVSDNWIISKMLPVTSGIYNWGPSFKVSKNVMSLGLKAELAGSYNDVSGTMIQNDVEFGYRNGSASLSFNGEISPLHWLNLSSKTEWNMNRIEIENLNGSDTGYIRNTVTVNIHLSESVTLDSMVDYFEHHGLSHSGFLMLNASMTWAVSPAVNLSFRMMNIGNRQSFETSNITPLVESIQTVAIRPTCFLFGLMLHR